MINLVDEISDLLMEYNLNLNDVVFVVMENVVENEDFLEKFDVFYDNGWGLCNFSNIQIVIDDYTWFERTGFKLPRLVEAVDFLDCFLGIH